MANQVNTLPARGGFATVGNLGQYLPVTTEDLYRILIQGGLILGAIFLAVFVAPANPFLVIGICLGLFLLIGMGRLGRSAWVLYPITSGFSGTIHLIPGGLSLFQIVCLVLLAMSLYLLKSDPSFRIKLGPHWIFWPFLILNLILLYGWIKGGDLGLNLLGSSKVGGKGYLNCIIPFLGYVAAISMYQPNSVHDVRLPLYVLSGYLFDTLIFGISTIVPAAAAYIFRFYDCVNVEAFQVLETSKTAGISEGFVLRFHQCGKLSYILLAALQVYFPYSRWLGLPAILVGPSTALFSMFLALISGFRNFIIRFAVTAMIGIWQSMRIFSLFLLLPVFALLGLLCVGQGTLFHLPLVVQRTLIFLPGDWDKSIAKGAEGSAEFRQDIKRVYFKEFFRKDNFWGDGFLYNREDLLSSQEQFWRTVGYQRQEDDDEQIRGFIIRRAHHEGIVDIHHLTGHVGTLVWVFFGFISLFRCGKYLVVTPLCAETLPAHFGATLTVVTVLTYWFLFGSLKEASTEILSFLFCFTSSLALCRSRWIGFDLGTNQSQKPTPVSWGPGTTPQSI